MLTLIILYSIWIGTMADYDKYRKQYLKEIFWF